MLGALITAACGNPDAVQNTSPEPSTEVANLELTPTQHAGLKYIKNLERDREAMATALSRVKEVMEQYLFDPSSATYKGIKLGKGSSICGQYNAKNRYGAYVGYKDFVVTGDKTLVASDTNGGIESSSNPEYVQAYLDSCATKAQIAAYGASSAAPSADAEYNYEPANDASSVDDFDVEQEPDQILDAPARRPSPERVGSPSPPTT